MDIKIEVFNKTNGELIGTDSYNENSYNWHLNTVKSFEFIPKNKDYVLGKFLVNSDISTTTKNQITSFFITEFKMLKRNCDPQKQFDDVANSIWEKFPNS